MLGTAVWISFRIKCVIRKWFQTQAFTILGCFTCSCHGRRITVIKICHVDVWFTNIIWMVGFINTRSCLVCVICFSVCSFKWTSSRFSSLPLPPFRPSPFQMLDYEQCFVLFEITYSLPCAYICSCHSFNVFVSTAFIFNVLFLGVFFSLHLSSPRWHTVKSRRGK